MVAIAAAMFCLVSTGAGAYESAKTGAAKGNQVGTASWYGPRFHGRKTASGDRFNQNALTAAHRKLPLGSTVKVTNLENGRAVVVEINDRGPYVRGRMIDLSRAAARRLGMTDDGLAKVRVEVLRQPDVDVADRDQPASGDSVPTF